jgi:hypothetical protein
VILAFKNLNNLVLIAKPHNLQTMNVEINEAISPKSNMQLPVCTFARRYKLFLENRGRK